MRCRRDPRSKGARLRAAARHAGASTPAGDPVARPRPTDRGLAAAAGLADRPLATPAPLRDPGAAPRHIDSVEDGSLRHAATVIIGPHGRVTGDLCAPEIIVLGQIKGDLVAGERIRLEAGARVYGNLSAPRIGILPGAQVSGRISARPANAIAALDDSP